jgi:mannose-6-phosphate isomerase-like protein (cupin superfamily)
MIALEGEHRGSECDREHERGPGRKTDARHRTIVGCDADDSGPGGIAVDVRAIKDVEPEVEHNGTVPVWYLVHPREMKALTDGGYLELVNEFEVAAGGAVFPHSHPTHEWYFVMSGRGVMTVDGEDRDVEPGDFVYIPPDLVHSLRPTGGGAIHCFCFAVAVKGAPEIDYTSH